LSTAGFVLLIVCASVANLAVARTIRREREMSLRTALGASRGRLLRQLVTESLLLSLAGGVAGLALAFVGMGLLVEYVQRFTARASEIRLDTTVLLFTLAVSLATGLIAGSIPALSRRLARGRPAADLRSRSPVARQDLRRALIIAQVAASFMLLIGAGLMLRSLLKLSGVDPGFSTEHVLTMQIDMNFTRYSGARARAAYLDRLGANVRALPGVKSAGASGVLPFSDNAGLNFGRFTIEGQPIAEPSRQPRASVTVANGDYFRAIDIPLVRGRLFSEEDTLDAPDVAIVNRSLAERHWPGQDPLAAGFRRGWQPLITIVGVIANVPSSSRRSRRRNLHSAHAAALRLDQLGDTDHDGSGVLAPCCAKPSAAPIRPARPSRPHARRHSRRVAHASTAHDDPAGAFAGLALVITATGIAGVIDSVSQRTQEFGVRMALGARRIDVVAMIVREGLRLILAGLTLGVVGAILLGAAVRCCSEWSRPMG
jgi:predicted permease